MYFGYNQMWVFTFVPVGFVITMAASVGFGLVYVVGARRGKAAAMRYNSVVAYSFLGLAALDLAWAAASGQLAGFLRAYGPGPLTEMIVLALMCVGSLWFMAVAYANSKVEE